jgi:hypothetical protein
MTSVSEILVTWDWVLEVPGRAGLDYIHDKARFDFHTGDYDYEIAEKVRGGYVVGISHEIASTLGILHGDDDDDDEDQPELYTVIRRPGWDD